jgi:very-short-patch-repair endonuclease
MFLTERSINFSREIRLVKWFADFVIDSFILEIDGQQHLQDDRKNKDVEKDQDLTNLGYRVVRIPWDGNHSKFFRQLEEFVLLL